jgi:pimeloyl-ACP methyl ester carboxylesterase
MLRSAPFRALLLLAPLAVACGDNDAPTGPSAPEPIAITEPFTGTLTPNGGRTHEFVVQQAGTLSVRLSALAPDDTVVIGLSLGTWNGQVCAATLPNDKATLNTVVTGTAQNTGLYCARVYDAAGTLTAATDYTIDVTHF